MLLVYTKENCPQCEMTKNALQNYKIPYTLIDIDKEPTKLIDVAGLGYRSLPIVLITNDCGEVISHWAGFNLDAIITNAL